MAAVRDLEELLFGEVKLLNVELCGTGTYLRWHRRWGDIWCWITWNCWRSGRGQGVWWWYHSHQGCKEFKGGRNLDTHCFWLLISYVSWVLASQIMSRSSHCIWKWDRNSGCRLCIMVCPKFLVDYFMHIFYTYCLGLMKSVGSHGSSSLLLMMKVKVSHYVSDSHMVMSAVIVMSC